MTRPLSLDITGCFRGFQVWLDGEPIGPVHPSWDDVRAAKAALQLTASFAMADLALCLAKAPAERKA